MNKQYEVYEFRYIDKKSKEIKTILASNVDEADLIIEIYNEYNDKFYDRKRFKFKKKVIVSITPKVLENQQRDTAEQERQNRINKLNNNIK